MEWCRVVLMLAIVVLSCSYGEVTRSSKKGMVIPWWPKHQCGDFDQFKTVSWWYNYRTHKDPREANPVSKWWCKCPSGETDKCLPGTDSGLDYVPMIQGLPGQGNHPDWVFTEIVDDGSQYLLGFNEPNQHEQSNLEPEQAAVAWIELQNNYPEKTLVSPAMANTDTVWFDAFWNKCQELGCRFDYIAVHMYSGKADDIISKLKAFSERYDNKKIWLTEFAVAKTNDEDQVVEFIQEILPQLEAAPFIFRYSWFVSRYYPKQASQMTKGFWIDPYVNSPLDLESSVLTRIGEAYDYPYHLEI